MSSRWAGNSGLRRDQVLNQRFSTSEMQPVLYAVESFDQIYEAAHEAEAPAFARASEVSWALRPLGNPG